MVTRAQLLKLTAQVEDLAGAFDPNPTVTVAVFDHETEEFAAKRYVRPEHRGMLVRFDHRREERGMLAEAFAVWAGATEEDAIMLRRQMERPLRRALGPGRLRIRPRWQLLACSSAIQEGCQKSKPRPPE
jgi:hypothetical protein